jgi:hypothetical protein
MNKVKITEKEVEKIGFDHDRDKIYNMSETTAHRLGIIVIIVLVFISGFLLITMPKEHHNYEVRAADGTIYHTTRIGYGYNNDRIWFRDENGNSIVLGGAYTIIDK